MANQNPPKKGPKKKSDSGDVEIFRAPEILREPSSKQVRLGGKIVLRVEATGMPLPSYQWYCNGAKVIGATSDRLVINKSRRNHGGAYTCEVKNHVGKVMSRAAMISFLLEKIPDVEVSPKAASVPSGKAFTFSIVSPSADKLEQFKFQWVFNGKRINGATGTSLEFTQVKKKYEGEYKVILFAGSEIRSSNVVQLKVLADEAAVETIETSTEPNQFPEGEDCFFDPEEEETEEPVAATAPAEEDFFFAPEDEAETIEHVEEVVEIPAEASATPAAMNPNRVPSVLERKRIFLERLLHNIAGKEAKKAA